ncbi:hypothetical protein B0H13DRAFT_2346540 [Mycena leptocephala]|nr:hypothetical protein B0H13DRAFT_2346540 [Mycena leptocephala]
MQPRPASLQLPSIRTLHLYPPVLGPGPSTSTSTYEPAQMSTQSQGAGAYPPSSHGGSDGDERGVTGENEPPKKKRRRQVLSCTENYVPRTEHDALCMRVDALEVWIQQVFAAQSLPPGVGQQPAFNGPGQGQGFNSPYNNTPKAHNPTPGQGLQPMQMPLPAGSQGHGQGHRSGRSAKDQFSKGKTGKEKEKEWGSIGSHNTPATANTFCAGLDHGMRETDAKPIKHVKHVETPVRSRDAMRWWVSHRDVRRLQKLSGHAGFPVQQRQWRVPDITEHLFGSLPPFQADDHEDVFGPFCGCPKVVVEKGNPVITLNGERSLRHASPPKAPSPLNLDPATPLASTFTSAVAAALPITNAVVFMRAAKERLEAKSLSAGSRSQSTSTMLPLASLTPLLFSDAQQQR